jgi:hypothetical protein
MEFQLFETVPVMDRTYCILPACGLGPGWGAASSMYGRFAARWDSGRGGLFVGRYGERRERVCLACEGARTACVGEELAEGRRGSCAWDVSYVTDMDRGRVMGFPMSRNKAACLRRTVSTARARRRQESESSVQCSAVLERGHGSSYSQSVSQLVGQLSWALGRGRCIC